MKKFIKKISYFVLIGIAITLLFFLSLLLPPTPKVSKSLLFSQVRKDSLLMNVVSPRIIFVGGSNLSFGLDSQRIKDSLKINPINTGVHGGIGLKYMMDNTLQYIKEGDIIVLIPEYFHFCGDFYSSSGVLLRTVFDVNKSKIKLLNYKQLFNCIPYAYSLAISRYNPMEYTHIEESEIYGVDSFNQYGDVEAHWNIGRQDFDPIEI